MELIKIKFGTSLGYYLWLVLCVGACLGLYFGLRKKSKKVQYWSLFGVLALNFALHFIKLAFPQYTGFPAILRKCSFENICAVSTMIFPFIYLSKWKAGKDYMFYLGLISGILGCVAPMPAASMNLAFYEPETIRYYICHAGIWIVPLLMVLFGLHELNWRRIWKTFVIYFAVLGVIIINELILIRIHWVDTPSFDEFFDANERDMGYAIGLPDSMQGAAKFVLWLTPKAWRNVPILWELFPVVILGGIFALAVCLIWDHKRFKTDMITAYNTVKVKVPEFFEKVKVRFKKAEKSETGSSADQDDDNGDTDDNTDNE